MGKARPSSPGSARLSPLDAAFLYFDRPEQRLHVGCVAMLDGRLDFGAFVGAVDTRIVQTLPRYRQRPMRRLLDWDLPQWEDAAGFDVRRHLHHVAVPSPGDDRALQDLIDELIATRLDPAHPLWEMFLIDGLSDNRSALLCKMHHSMIDGVSGAQVLAALTDPVDAPPAALPPGGAPLGEASPWTLTSLRENVRDATEALGLLADMVWRPSPATPFNGRLSDARRVVWASLAIDDILAIRGAAGVTMNDVVLAIITSALRAAFLARGVVPPPGGLRTIAPVSMRQAGERLQLGNLVAAMFPRLPVEVADPAERLRRIARDTRDLKSRGQARAVGRALGFLGFLPTPLAAWAGRFMEGPLSNTVCTNVPGPREHRTLLGVRIADIHPIVPLFFGMGVEFAILSYADRLSISAVADPHLVPEIEAFAGWLHGGAAELRAALVTDLHQPPASLPGPSLHVHELMSRPVRSVAMNATLAAVTTLMANHRVRHVPVVDGAGRLVGLVTQRDILSIQPSRLDVSTDADRLALLARVPVADVMETHLAVSTPDELAATAGERLRRHRIGCLPVIDAAGHLTGIVTRTDFLAWATHHLAPANGTRAT